MNIKRALFTATLIGSISVLALIWPQLDSPRITPTAQLSKPGASDEIDQSDHLVSPEGGSRGGGLFHSLRAFIGLSASDSDRSSWKTDVKLTRHSQNLVRALEETLSQDLFNESRVVVEIIRNNTELKSLRILSPNITVPTKSSLSQCVPGKARGRMLNLFGSNYDPDIFPFVRSVEDPKSPIMSLPPPFGFSKLDGALNSTLSVVKNTGFSLEEKKSCLRCAVIGNGGILTGSNVGSVIDEHDIIIRLNDAPVRGHQKDVGSKTTLRFAYPESSFRSSAFYDAKWLYVVVVFKVHDLTWLTNVASGKPVNNSKNYWRAVARTVPKAADEFRVFNPLIVRETATNIGFNIGTGKMKKNVPTTGSFAISAATRLCDEVSVAGFGYSENKPMHYFDAMNMKVVKNSATHNIVQEKKWLLKLVQQGIIKDLTGGIK